MPFLPPSIATAPTIQKAPFGLFSVANVIATNDPHIAGGVNYESSLLCAGGSVIASTNCTYPALGAVGGGPAYTTAVAALINSEYKCMGPLNLPEFQAEATKAAAANQERLLSAALFEGVFPPSGATAVALTNAAPVDALAALEGLARMYYSGQPVIHASASLVSSLTSVGAVVRAGDHLETLSGARVHAIANPDTTVMYLTGALTIWKGPNRVLDPIQERTAGGAPLNSFRTVALTPVAVANDCGIFFKVTGVKSSAIIPAATGVTAGAPGTIAPAGTIPPYDLGDLSSDPVIGNTGTAKPSSTPWTGLQYINLGDGSKASWNGTKWVGFKP